MTQRRRVENTRVHFWTFSTVSVTIKLYVLNFFELFSNSLSKTLCLFSIEFSYNAQIFILLEGIFLSVIAQRWGVWTFDLVTTQLVQENVEKSKRNRVSAAQMSLNATSGILVNVISLIWSTPCTFGTAVIFCCCLIIIGYVIYFYWSFSG